MNVVGRGLEDDCLAPEELVHIVREGLARLPLDGQRVLVLIPDGTRTMPMPLMFEVLERELGPRVAALDFLVALGTHSPMSDEQLSAPRRPAGGRRPRRRAADLQPPLGRPGHVRDARHDPRRARSSR